MTFWERQSKDYIKELSISGENIFLRGRETPMCEKYIDQLPLAWPQLGTQPTTQACDLTGNRTGDPLVHRPALNPLSHRGTLGPMKFKKSNILEILLSKKRGKVLL